MYIIEKSAGQSPFLTSKHPTKSGFPLKFLIVGYVHLVNSYLLFFHFIVPPDPVVIFDENGTRRKVFVGPYQLGDTISLVCDAFGGESGF